MGTASNPFSWFLQGTVEPKQAHQERSVKSANRQARMDEDIAAGRVILSYIIAAKDLKECFRQAGNPPSLDVVSKDRKTTLARLWRPSALDLPETIPAKRYGPVMHSFAVHAAKLQANDVIALYSGPSIEDVTAGRKIAYLTSAEYKPEV